MWKEIADLVGKGVDQIKPSLAMYKPDIREGRTDGPNAGVVKSAETTEEVVGESLTRHSRPGVCRWTRIYDLLAEDLLEVEPGPRMRDALRELLERAAGTANSRQGGRALFCVLAIEWILRSYSPLFIRRICPWNGEDKSPSAVLLAAVLELTETPAEALPAALSAAVSKGTLPLALAAPIHHRFRLGSPPNGGKLVSDLHALEMALKSTGDDGQAEKTDLAAWLRTLALDAKVLDPTPFSPVEDFPLKENTKPLAPEEVLVASQSRLEEIQEGLKRSRKWLDERKSKPVAELTEEEKAEANRIRELVKGCHTVTEQAMAELAALRDSGQASSGELPERIANLEMAWQDLKTGAHQRLLQRYPQVETPQQAESAPPKTPATDSVTAKARPQADSAAEVKPAQADPLVELTELAAGLRKRLCERFDSDLASFDAYSPDQTGLGPLQALRMSVAARKAEMLYRVGLRGEARKQWMKLLREDRFDLRLLHNIAVCETTTGDVQSCLSAWRNYMNMLYFQALAANDLTFLSSDRRDFHRDFGNAYGLRFLFEEKEEGRKLEPDVTEVEEFVSSPSRVRLYMRHNLLACFNQRLGCRTAPLILGVSRTAGEAEREAARTKMDAWSAKLCAWLPRRTAARFSTGVSHRLAKACEAMKDPKQMRDLREAKSYVGETKQHLLWIKEVFDWKYRLYLLIQKIPDLALNPEYLTAIAELSAADEIPIDTGKGWLEAVARQQKQEPDVLLCLVGRASNQPVFQVLKFVFSPGGFSQDGKDALRQSIYRRLTGELAAGRLLTDQMRQVIDNPGNISDLDFYPASVRGALTQSEKPADEAVACLHRLHETYDRSAGIAYHYALLLAFSGNLAECKKVVKQGITNGFHESGKEQCQQLLEQIAQYER